MSKAKHLNDPLAVAPVFPFPGDSANPLVPDIRPVYWFTKEEMVWLKEYSKHLDPYQAGKTVGWNSVKVNNEMKKQQIREEVLAIHDAWKKSIHMTGEKSSSRFLNIMDKIEADYDKQDPFGQNLKLAGPLAKMASDYLKATGQFDKAGVSTTPQIQFNLQVNGAQVQIKQKKTKQADEVEVEETIDVTEINPHPKGTVDDL